VKNLYCDVDGDVMGPFDANELRSLVAEGVVARGTLIWKEGSSKKVVADSISGLFSETTSGPPREKEVSRNDDNDEQTTHLDGAATKGTHSERARTPVGEAGIHSLKGHAVKLLADLKGVNFKEEVLPVDQQLITTITRDVVFWTVTTLAVVPLLIATIERTEFQLTAFALFFAVLWMVMFKLLIVQSEVGWKLLITSLFFTGLLRI